MVHDGQPHIAVWHWEGNVQARITGHLQDVGWTVLRASDTLTRQRIAQWC